MSEKIWFGFTVFTVLSIFLLSLDDLFVDVVAFVCRLGPHELMLRDLAALHLASQKRIAIMIANWHEDEIIERMIRGNIGRIDYVNYDFFLGVYPNDRKTMSAVKRLQSFHHNVYMVVNAKEGPTSKGQMLNEIVTSIQATEIKHGVFYDILMLHDSEDIIHPLSLKLVNSKMEESDFLQTPVFSLPTSWSELTRGTYIDEFAESHSRDMLVRSYLKAGVPSAGVGTAMSRLFVSELLQYQDNRLLNEETLTEDYHLGLMAHRLGYKNEFVCCFKKSNGIREYLATREYFPASVQTSIRQKTRWTLGISIQGMQNLKWSEVGSWCENYFLWRDRRGLINAPILLCSYLLTLSFIGYYSLYQKLPPFFEQNQLLITLFGFSFVFMLNRLFQRMKIVNRVYGIRVALMAPIRWILANYINSIASLKAVRQQIATLRTGERPQWVKTTHELPEMFGQEVSVNSKLDLKPQHNLANGLFVLFFAVVLPGLSLLPSKGLAVGNCVQIYYDKGPEGYWIGRTYAIFTQNLLGHFPELQQIISPVEYYKKGDLERCRASIYIGSHYESQIPEVFISDYVTTKRNVAWLGYNIWRKTELAALFGYKYSSLTKLNSEKLDYLGNPTYFKWIDYKGERFSKFGEWSRTPPKAYLAPFEMIELIPEPLVFNETQILATAVHNGTGEVRPYILQKQNHFYVADVPFSFMHEADRYLVFADLLFDILDLPPRHPKKMAVMRMEDVDPLIPLEYLYLFSRTLQALDVPVNVSIIPFFFDPLNVAARAFNEEFVAASQKIEFVEWVKGVQQKGATFIWHGVTHQYGRSKNPHSGTTGSDFEFWDAVQNRPVEKDGVKWVLNRLYDGYYELNKIGVHPSIWLTPHYQASTLDNILFGRVMPWNMGRVIYFNYELLSPELPRHEALWYSNTSQKIQDDRVRELSDIRYKITSPWWNGQIFPYEIYGDIHGQRILPENLGNSQPVENAHVIRPRAVQEIVRDAKRNLVLRDVWASYFYHPSLFDPYDEGGRGQFRGDPSELVYLITEIKKLGYEFIDLESFAKQNVKYLRPDPIYVEKKNVNP
ncbi:MAG: phage adsorption protein NrfB [Bdellovibrionales bacterium]|nr:phage adsorption protein NrfB [Bdellovibrionales bacterium]